MFNLLIKYNGWDPSGSDRIDITRILEGTEDAVKDRFRVGNGIDFDSLRGLPTVMMPEISDRGNEDQTARVAKITGIQRNQNNVHIEYVVDQQIPPIANESMFEMLTSAGVLIESERRRTHWAVKDADLYACIARAQFRHQLRPTVFELRSVAGFTKPTVAVMMPFSSDFAGVYEQIKTSVESRHLQCQRADEISKNESVVQDVVDLVVGSRAVIVDCTDQNANVFYEMGIAHTVGRPVILIVQNRRDIPFDIGHLRYIHYYPNQEGLEQLGVEIDERLATLGLVAPPRWSVASIRR